jgi:hypothetical protein
LNRWGKTLAALGLAGGSALAMVYAAGCTVFDGLVAERDAGHDADADAGDDGGDLPRGYLTLDEAARLCGLAAACPKLAGSIIASLGLPIDGLNASICATWLAGPVPPNRPGFAVQRETLKGLAAASSCELAALTLPFEVIDAIDPRCAGLTGYQCIDGDRAVANCDLHFIQHCDSKKFGAGSSCRIGLQDTGRCALGGCLEQQIDCKGDVSTVCDLTSLLRLQYDCAFNGLQCGDGSGPGAYCGSAQGALVCDSPSDIGTGRCEDDVLLVCDGLELVDFDCSSLGGSCNPDNPTAGCVLPGAACSPENGDETTCSGDVLSLCVAGRRRSVDCEAIGMSCVAASGGRTARCEQ